MTDDTVANTTFFDYKMVEKNRPKYLQSDSEENIFKSDAKTHDLSEINKKLEENDLEMRKVDEKQRMGNYFY